MVQLTDLGHLFEFLHVSSDQVEERKTLKVLCSLVGHFDNLCVFVCTSIRVHVSSGGEYASFLLRHFFKVSVTSFSIEPSPSPQPPPPPYQLQCYSENLTKEQTPLSCNLCSHQGSRIPGGFLVLGLRHRASPSRPCHQWCGLPLGQPQCSHTLGLG